MQKNTQTNSFKNQQFVNPRLLSFEKDIYQFEGEFQSLISPVLFENPK